MTETCDWIETVDGWETDCGLMLTQFQTTPDMAGVIACIHCGKLVQLFYGTEPEALTDSGEAEHD